MPVRSEQRVALLVLILVLILNAVSLSAELAVGRVTGNDNISHWALIQELVHAVETGQNPLDFWSPAAGLGSPVIRTYQPLAQIIVALVYFALGKTVSLLTVFVWVRFLAIACFPAAVFGGLRLMDFPPLTAAAGAVLAPLISTANLYGLDDSSYVTAGRGLYPQSVAAILLFLAIGYGFRALRTGRACALAGVFLGLTAVTHFIYGWMGALTLCLAVVLPDAVTRLLRLRRLAGVALAALAVSIFQIVPVILDRAILNHSRWEDAWKWDSFGAAYALKNLFGGDLLDYNRPAVLSLLALSGAALLLWRVYKIRRLDLRESFVLTGALLWLLIFFGRPTWGPLLTLLGATADLHLHRTIGGLHIFLLLLASLALSAAWSEAQRRGYAILAGIGILVLLAPMLVQRSRYLDRNESESAQRLDLVQAEQPSLDAVLANLKQTGGRAYAGSGVGWGPQFALGGIPVFAFLYTNNIPQTSTTYHLLALTSDLLPDFDETRPSHYALFNVRSVVAPAQRAASLPAFLTPRGNAGRFRLFNTPAAGYFDVVDATEYRAFAKQDFYEVNHQWLKSEAPEKKQYLLLTPSSPITRSEGSPGEVRSETREGQAYEAVLNANHPAYALFKMTWHPKWKALVDGAPAATAMLSPGFIGVPLTQGTHTVRLQYEPGPLKPILAGVGLLVALAACLWERL